MIVVNAPLKSNDITELLTNQEDLTFVEKKGMKLFFETTSSDETQRARDIRALIKEQPWGTGIFIHTEVV